ncbi:MAG: bifunctional (p)ppGpp synthetase/guanosine-3',5'-bis(diphosphate) 3'-pyrophosphohydrolase [Planctomycetota bacterium]|nr:MAG: bifunctional (p)ppGpp synthetase/guanosine-3',5'-bis(diphosphate) 3'-pyrophosphohydrolase [Planctomycetota bacterium]
MQWLEKAYQFANKAHQNQLRKTLPSHNTPCPYIAHPMDVAATLMKYGAPKEVVVAGLLHDTVEDTSTTLEEIKENFGEEVAELVRFATESAKLSPSTQPLDKKLTWRQRKEETIAKIKTATYPQKLLACADKLCNLKDIWAEQMELGQKVWTKFNAPKADQKWYYQSLLEAFTSPPHSLQNSGLFLQLRFFVELTFSNQNRPE